MSNRQGGAATSVNAVNFAQSFVHAASKSRGAVDGGSWTDVMYEVLHDVQSTFGLWCQCAHHAAKPAGGVGERLKVDLLWFPQHMTKLPEDEQEWIAPLVAIEHENGHHSRDRAIDHWKVSQVAAPLRVFIGYAKHAKDVDNAASVLQEREQRWNALPNGEALIILGHADMRLSCFRLWSALQGTTKWREIGKSHCEC